PCSVKHCERDRPNLLGISIHCFALNPKCFTAPFPQVPCVASFGNSPRADCGFRCTGIHAFANQTPVHSRNPGSRFPLLSVHLSQCETFPATSRGCGEAR